MENENQKNDDLLQSQGLTYTRKSKKLEDAKSSAGLFIGFGIVGLLALIALWLGIIPLAMATYMKILYTIILGALFIIFIILGFYYRKKVRVLETETDTEEQLSNEIITWVTSEYTLEALDSMISAESLPMEQLYFERYEKIVAIITEKYQIEDEKFLDYLVEKIYQIYSPE